MKIVITEKQLRFISEVGGTDPDPYEELLMKYKEEMKKYNIYMDKRKRIMDVFTTVSLGSNYDKYNTTNGYDSKYFKVEGNVNHSPESTKTNQTIINAINQFKRILGNYKPSEQFDWWYSYYDKETKKVYCKWFFNIPYLPKIKKPIPPKKPTPPPQKPTDVKATPPSQPKKPEPRTVESLFVDNSLIGFRLDNDMFKPIKPEEFGTYAVRADTAKTILQPGNEEKLNAYVAKKIPNYQGLYK